MAIATFVVEFEGGCPAVGAGTEILGGKLVGVQFNDALEELDRHLGAVDRDRVPRQRIDRRIGSARPRAVPP